MTAVWGATFVTVKQAVAQYPTLPFLALRFGVGALAMAPMAWLGRRGFRRSDLAAGACAGAFLFGGYTLQTLALERTTASQVAFVNGLSVVLVPLYVGLLARQWPSPRAVSATVLAVAGLALLSLNAGLAIARGDLLALGGAVSFAAHITALAMVSPGRDPRLLCLIQLATAALLGSTAAVWSGSFPPVPGPVWGAAVFTGTVATALAFLVQTAAQQFTTAGHTALILSAEPVWAAICGVLLAGERLSARAWVGCAVILAGVVLGALAQADSGSPAPAARQLAEWS